MVKSLVPTFMFLLRFTVHCCEREQMVPCCVPISWENNSSGQESLMLLPFREGKEIVFKSCQPLPFPSYLQKAVCGALLE